MEAKKDTSVFYAYIVLGEIKAKRAWNLLKKWGSSLVIKCFTYSMIN